MPAKKKKILSPHKTGTRGFAEYERAHKESSAHAGQGLRRQTPTAQSLPLRHSKHKAGASPPNTHRAEPSASALKAQGRGFATKHPPHRALRFGTQSAGQGLRRQTPTAQSLPSRHSKRKAGAPPPNAHRTEPSVSALKAQGRGPAKYPRREAVISPLTAQRRRFCLFLARMSTGKTHRSRQKIPPAMRSPRKSIGCAYRQEKTQGTGRNRLCSLPALRSLRHSRQSAFGFFFRGAACIRTPQSIGKTPTIM